MILMAISAFVVTFNLRLTVVPFLQNCHFSRYMVWIINQLCGIYKNSSHEKASTLFTCDLN